MPHATPRTESDARLAGIARWSPDYARFDPFLGASHRSALTRFFEEAGGAPWTEGNERLLAPALDVYENDKTLTFRIDLPGVAKDDIKVQIQEGILSISGERNPDLREDLGTCQRMERRSGTFYRSLTLPPTVDTDGSIAEFVDGVLTVRVPKRASEVAKDVKVR